MHSIRVIEDNAMAKLVRGRLDAARQWRQSLNVLNCSVDDWINRVNMALNKTHEPAELAAIPQMAGYFGLTLLKTNSAVARLKSVYAHAIDAPFVLKPSPLPELPLEAIQSAEAALKRRLYDRLASHGLRAQDVQDDKGNVNMAVTKWLREQYAQLQSSLVEEHRKIANAAIPYHSDKITKQMREGGMAVAMSLFLRDLVSMPYAVMAGGQLEPTDDWIWSGGQARRVVRMQPRFRRVNPADAYIGADSTSAHDGCGVTEVIYRRRDEMEQLARSSGGGKTDYRADAIYRVLEKFNARSLDWLGFGSVATNSLIDERNTWQKNSKESIRCLIHHGIFSGEELGEAGISGFGDENDFHKACVETCDDEVLRVYMLPFGVRYYSANYKHTGDSYAGASVAMMLRDRQVEINRVLYAKNRNLWHASGPSVIMNAGYFEHPEDVRLAPFGVQMANPKDQSGKAWGLQQINVSPMFAAIHEEARRIMVLADEECGVPSMFSGMSRGGVSRTTLGGAVLEQTNGELGMADAMINFDMTVVAPMVKALHLQNVQSEHNKQYRRGDIDVEGRGVTALRERELRQRMLAQALPQLMQTSQSGLTPTPMLEQAIRDYFEGQGVDVSSMPGPAASHEISNIVPPQTNDGRTYNPNQAPIGLIQ